jgi:hypothetical protein
MMCIGSYGNATTDGEFRSLILTATSRNGLNVDPYGGGALSLRNSSIHLKASCSGSDKYNSYIYLNAGTIEMIATNSDSTGKHLILTSSAASSFVIGGKIGTTAGVDVRFDNSINNITKTNIRAGSSSNTGYDFWATNNVINYSTTIDDVQYNTNRSRPISIWITTNNDLAITCKVWSTENGNTAVGYRTYYFDAKSISDSGFSK